MGKVIVAIKLTNLKDAFLKAAGVRPAKPRVVEVEALVDTGATRLYLKPSVIKRLGLGRAGTGTHFRNTLAPTGGEGRVRGRGGHLARKPCRTALSQVGSDAVILPRKNAEAAKTQEGGASSFRILPSAFPLVPLEVLDFVVDAKGQKLIPNPAHGGEQMTEEF